MLHIFHPDCALPQMTSACLLQYASFFSGLNYSVHCKKGKTNENVDCFSHSPVSSSNSDPAITMDEEVNPLNAETLTEETAKHPELQVLLSKLKNSSTDTPYTVFGNTLF